MYSVWVAVFVFFCGRTRIGFRERCKGEALLNPTRKAAVRDTKIAGHPDALPH